MSESNGSMPECSVLRRHWQSMQELKTAQPSSASQSNSAASGGIFGWLKSLFS